MSESQDKTPRGSDQSDAKGETQQAAGIPVELFGEMVKTMQAMQARADTRPATPDPEAFSAGKGYYVIGNDGERYRHGLRPEGDSTLLDEKLRPVVDA